MSTTAPPEQQEILAQSLNGNQSSRANGSGGFAGGTLMQTKNGLVPIEQIKIGDLA